MKECSTPTIVRKESRVEWGCERELGIAHKKTSLITKRGFFMRYFFEKRKKNRDRFATKFSGYYLIQRRI